MNEPAKVWRKLKYNEQENFKILNENNAIRLQIKLIKAEFENTKLEGDMVQANNCALCNKLLCLESRFQNSDYSFLDYETGRMEENSGDAFIYN